MNKPAGALGIVLILAAVILIRIPSQSDSGMTFTGLLITENVADYEIMAQFVPAEEGEIGIALQEYELDYGTLSQGMNAKKTIRLESSSVPVKIRAWIDGDISGYADISKNDFVLNSPDVMEVGIRAGNVGNYSGTLHISSRGFNYHWLRWMTQWL
jgi:hypothetical protein